MEGLFLTFVSKDGHPAQINTIQPKNQISIEHLSIIRQYFDPLDKISGLINVKEALIVSTGENNADNLMRRLQNYVSCIQNEAIRRF